MQLQATTTWPTSVRPDRILETLAAATLFGIAVLPLTEVMLRPILGVGIPGSIDLVRHLTLWIAFTGAVVATIRSQHLTIGTTSILAGNSRRRFGLAGMWINVFVCTVLAVASLEMVRAEMSSAVRIAGHLPVWIAELVMPVGLTLCALCTLRVPPQRIRTMGGSVLLCATILAFMPEDWRPALIIPGAMLMVIATAVGTPIFVTLGGIAALLFYVDGVPLASIAVEGYRIATNPILPTIPLFTLAGTLLAAGEAPQRLERVFSSVCGRLPGGQALAVITLCTFFTMFTGGSGVTILALGSLVLPILVRAGYSERFAIGLVTAAGSLGILFPPSLVMILYAVTGQTALDRLFIGGLVPGFVLFALMAGYVIVSARRSRWLRPAASCSEVRSALVEAKWELVLVPLVAFSIFSGIATMVEIASLTVLYVSFVEFAFHRNLSLRRDMGRLFTDSASLSGAVMIVLVMAMGLSSYLVYADIPGRAADWVQSIIQSKWVFLLALNFFLLLAGCLLDIFSAIVVVVPLVLPVALAYGIDPVHLGIIFLANMELGYLTPPVGLNLLLGAVRFQRSLVDLCRATLPFVLILLVGVLLITFVPVISVGVVNALK